MIYVLFSRISSTQYCTYNNYKYTSGHKKFPLHFDYICMILHPRNCLTLFSTCMHTSEGRAVRGELQLLVHCYMRSRVTCAEQVFCKMHHARAAKLENSYIPDDINLSLRAICAICFNATTRLAVMAL